MLCTIKKAGLIAMCLILTASFFVLPVSADDTLIIKKNGVAEKHIALTFDDGPHGKYTDIILDILKENDVKATFFVIGENAAIYPEKVKRIHDEGHEIGNHTFKHVYISECSADRISKELKDTDDAIFAASGIRPKIFRPPGGCYNEKSISHVKKLGYDCILWSIDTRDWALPGTEKVISTVMNETAGGDIILFHDFNQKGSPTPEAVRKLIPMLKEKGYSFVTVSELLAIERDDNSKDVGTE